MTSPTEAMVRAADDLYRALMSDFPELPEVVFVVGSSGRKKNSQVHGHFAPASWEGGVHEIFLSGESLARGAEATATTIIHEAAHALAHAREVRDTSNQGRYHNSNFQKIAYDLGIIAEINPADPTRGYSTAHLSEGTRKRYSAQITGLAEALTTFRVVREEAPAKPKKSTVVKIDCECDHPFNMNRKWWDENGGSLHCNDCFSDYAEISE